MANKDVELVVRMRDQASRTAQAIAAALVEMANAQSTVAGSAGKTDSLLAQLGAEFKALESDAKGLSSLGRIADQMDKAGAAVGRLETSLASARAEEARLIEQQRTSAANASALAKSAQDAKAALDAQRATRDQIGK